MSSKRWKQVERIFASYFGTERVPLSGGNSKHTRSDTLHPELFLEVKQTAVSAVATLYEKTVAMAKVEGKTPALGIHKKGTRDWLIVCEIRDLPKVTRLFEEAAQMKGVSNAGTDKAE